MRFWGVLIFILIVLIISVPIFLYGAFGKAWVDMNWRTEVHNDSVSGILLRSQNWSGEVKVTGDVYAAWWARINIAPGTEVNVAANDDQETGQDPGPEPLLINDDDPTKEKDYTRRRIEIKGTIMAEGSEEEPIYFVPVEPNTEYAAWQGITLRDGSFLSHVNISNVQVGLRSDGDTKLENVNVSHCLWDCLRVIDGQAQINDSTFAFAWHRAGIISGDAKPFLQRNIFSNSATGLELRNNSAPTVISNTFSDNVIAINLQTSGEAKFSGNTLVSPVGPGVAGGTYRGDIIYPNTWEAGQGIKIEGTNLLNDF